MWIVSCSVVNALCRLKDWVLRMIYMLVLPEEEEPWPTPFIQEDWCVFNAVISTTTFVTSPLHYHHNTTSPLFEHHRHLPPSTTASSLTIITPGSADPTLKNASTLPFHNKRLTTPSQHILPLPSLAHHPPPSAISHAFSHKP